MKRAVEMAEKMVASLAARMVESWAVESVARMEHCSAAWKAEQWAVDWVVPSV